MSVKVAMWKNDKQMLFDLICPSNRSCDLLLIYLCFHHLSDLQLNGTLIFAFKWRKTFVLLCENCFAFGKTALALNGIFNRIHLNYNIQQTDVSTLIMYC